MYLSPWIGWASSSVSQLHNLEVKRWLPTQRPSSLLNLGPFHLEWQISAHLWLRYTNIAEPQPSSKYHWQATKGGWPCRRLLAAGAYYICIITDLQVVWFCMWAPEARLGQFTYMIQTFYFIADSVFLAFVGNYASFYMSLRSLKSNSFPMMTLEAAVSSMWQCTSQ